MSRLRFAVSPVSPRSLGSPASPASPGAPGAPGAPSSPLSPRACTIDLPRSEGLDLLDWLGLGRPEFGAISARELAPRCRRRLWDVERNAHASLRARTVELLSIAEAAQNGMVIFG
jgi:hypothetical protein